MSTAHAATPRRLDAAVRAAAGEALGTDLALLPSAEPRYTGEDARFSSAVALRLGGASAGGPRAVAERIAARLAHRPEVAGARATGRGFVEFDAAPGAFAGLVAAARNGPALLTGGGWAALPDPGRPGWELTPLGALPGTGAARAAARDDARRRIALALRAQQDAESSAGPDPGPGPDVLALPGTGWREPAADAPGTGPAARLLAAVGESAARFAFCRAAADHPRPGEATGPDLPAEPTAEAPGEWARYTAANPAFAVRYAHAHAAASLRWAIDAGATDPGRGWEGPLTGASARLAGALFGAPAAVAAAGRHRRPHMLVRYVEGLAAAYQEWARFHDRASAGGAASSAVAVRFAVTGVLGAGAALLGVSAPTRP